MKTKYKNKDQNGKKCPRSIGFPIFTKIVPSTAIDEKGKLIILNS
jgi:hypothetical protein